ncbi:MAG TPA: M48 family metalloprotease [Pyrinomonadaceae bacterium]
MKYEKYISLIKSLEIAAAKNRKLYELKVIAIASLGYLYFFGLILLFIALPVIAILITLINPEVILRILLWTAKLWWAAIPLLAVYFGFLGAAVKAIFTKIPEPEGRTLEKSDVPGLFDFIEKTSVALKAPPPRKIFITDEFNAAVITVPRIGLFGTRSYMSLGLPLMTALSPEQLNAVIAHELGHISGKHGGFGKWAYQVQEAWSRFLESQDLHDHKFSALYEKFVNWFFPYFQAYSFVLRREHEKEADDYAVEIAGAKALGGALITLHTGSSALDRDFWPEIHRQNQADPTPASDVFSRMLGTLAFADPDRGIQSLEKAVAIPTDYNDSHPSLAERLKRMRYWAGSGLPKLPEPVTLTAAQFYLGAKREALVSVFEQQWAEEIAKTWGARFEQFKTSRERGEELETKATGEGLTVEELLERAGIIAEQSGNKEALPLLREAIAKNPDHAEANYILGAVLLHTEDEESGLGLLRRAMELDEKWKYSASDAAFQYLRMKGRLEEAKGFAEILESQQEEYQQAQRERQQVNADDTFLAHTLSEEAIAEVVRKLRYYDEITKIYIVRKEVYFLKEIDMHVLFYEKRKSSRFKNSSDMNDQDLINAIVKRLEGSEIAFFAALAGEHAKTAAKLDRIENSLIFDRTAE